MARQGKNGPRKQPTREKVEIVVRQAPAAQACPGKKNAKKKGASSIRGQAQNALVPGCAQTPLVNFGGTGGKLTKRFLRAAMTAYMPQHLPLPRAVGPYQVIRTSRRMTANGIFTIFGTFMDPEVGGSTGAPEPAWTNVCAIADVAVGTAVNAANNATKTVYDMSALSGAVTIAPSALTIQVMNPTALQTAAGMNYMGRSTAQYQLGADTRTWQEIADGFVAFMSPRLVAAAKLCLRGVTVNSSPLNMSALADFRPLSHATNGAFTWDASAATPQGLAPIILYNPSGTVLEVLVTTEWRVRFDPTNPAASSHTYHSPAPQSAWDSLCASASSEGHGVVDIVEGVADLGMALGEPV